MNVSIRRIEEHENEQVIIECVEVTSIVEDIKNYVQSKGTVFAGKLGERIYQIRLDDVLYFEAIDKRTFAYTKDKVYELKARLYELENTYKDMFFLRCSKSNLVNIMRLDSISPALNGRFTAHMQNGEKVIISRQYAPNIINVVLEEK